MDLESSELDRDARDAHFPELTEREGRILRALIVRTMNDHGVEAIDRGDHLDADDGRIYTLMLFTRRAAILDRAAWPQMVADLVSSLLTDRPAPDDLTRDDMLSRVLPRLWPAEAFPEDDWPAPSYRLFIGDLPLLAVISFDDTAGLVNDAMFARMGGPDVVWDRAAGNLRAEQVPIPETVEHENGSLLSFEGGSAYLSSWLSDPAEFARRSALRPGPLGLLMSAPGVNMLAVHRLSDESTPADLELMLTFTRDIHGMHPDPLGTGVFWAWGDSVRLIADSDGKRREYDLPSLLEHLQPVPRRAPSRIPRWLRDLGANLPEPGA
jgi:hypothetical protein